MEHWLGKIELEEDAFLRRLLAMICAKLGRNDEAEAHLRVALAQRPDVAATRRMLGMHLYQHAGGDRARLVEALDLWDSAQRLDEDDEDDEVDEDDEDHDALYSEIREDIVESLRLHDEAADAAS